MGTTIINVLDKTITFNELSVDVGHGAFVEICKASEEMVDKFLTENKEMIRVDALVGMEIPPVTGMYAVKLWALDTHLYNNLVMNDIYLFNVPYLKFINKKYEGKKDTKQQVEDLIKTFKDNLESGRKHLQAIYLIRLISKTYKEFIQLNNKKEQPIKTE